eukprot:356137-Pleurochrysis_carterae.AAC.1
MSVSACAWPVGTCANPGASPHDLTSLWRITSRRLHRRCRPGPSAGLQLCLGRLKVLPAGEKISLALTASPLRRSRREVADRRWTMSSIEKGGKCHDLALKTAVLLEEVLSHSQSCQVRSVRKSINSVLGWKHLATGLATAATQSGDLATACSHASYSSEVEAATDGADDRGAVI